MVWVLCQKMFLIIFLKNMFVRALVLIWVYRIKIVVIKTYFSFWSLNSDCQWNVLIYQEAFFFWEADLRNSIIEIEKLKSENQTKVNSYSVCCLFVWWNVRLYDHYLHLTNPFQNISSKLRPNSIEILCLN